MHRLVGRATAVHGSPITGGDQEGRGEQGSATAEFAVALPAIIVVLLALLTTGSAVVSHVQAIGAATACVRAIAIGEGPLTPAELGVPSATVTSGVSGSLAVTTVVVPVRGFFGLWSVSAKAMARPEREWSAGATVDSGHSP